MQNLNLRALAEEAELIIRSATNAWRDEEPQRGLISLILMDQEERHSGLGKGLSQHALPWTFPHTAVLLRALSAKKDTLEAARNLHLPSLRRHLNRGDLDLVSKQSRGVWRLQELRTRDMYC